MENLLFDMKNLNNRSTEQNEVYIREGCDVSNLNVDISLSNVNERQH